MMNKTHPALPFAHIINRPLALLPSAASRIKHGVEAHGPEASFGGQFGFWDGAPMVVIDGVAVILVSGILLSGAGGWGFPVVSFYEDIREKFDAALHDPKIDAITLWVDSPGGMVAGCFELAEHIRASRGLKPTAAIVYDSACSAAYALACAAETVTLPATGTAGSVGVIMIHTDYSRLLEGAGITTTIFRYGAHKADLQETEPVTPDAAARTQDMIDKLGNIFVEHVARCRGLSPEVVRAQEASVYLGRDALQAGLVDAVMAPGPALDDLVANLRAAPDG